MLGQLVEETVRESVTIRRYWVNEVSFLITIFAFMLIFFSAMAGSQPPAVLSGMRAGWILWFYSLTTFSLMGFTLANVMNQGTLEHLALSPAGLGSVLFARVLVRSALATLYAAVVVGALALTMGLPARIPAGPVAVIILLNLVRTLGLGFGYAGIALLYKRTDQFANLLQNLFLFLSGAIFPVERMPLSLRAIAETIPITHAVRAIRLAVDGDLGVGAMGAYWLPLAALSGAYLVLGVAMYAWCEGRARYRGSMARY